MAALAAILSVALPQVLVACTCSGSAGPAAYGHARSVFAGRLILQHPSEAGQVELRFQVSRYWKGDGAPTVILRAGDATSCDLPFQVGSVYLVYTRPSPVGGPAQWTGGVCDRTRKVAYARAELAALGPGWAPRQQVPAPGRTLPLLKWSTLVVTLALLLGASLRWRRPTLARP